MGRGKKILTPAHHAAMQRVRDQYASYVVVGLEIQERVAELERTLRTGAEDNLRAAIFAAMDAGVPQQEIKRILEIKNHDTFRTRWVDSYVPPIVKTAADFGPFSATFRVLHDNDTVAEREGGPADWYFKAHISQYRDWNLSLWLGMGMFNRFGWWVDDKREAWQDIPDDFRSQVLDEDGVLHAEFVDWLKTEVFPVFTKATQ
jgi:hypothetical protein